MELLVILIWLGLTLVALIALVGIVWPIPRIGLPTRKKSLGIFVLSFVSFLFVPILLLEAEHTGASPGWRWLFFSMIVFWLYRLVRSGTRQQVTSESDSLIRSPDPVTHDTVPTTPVRYKPVFRPSGYKRLRPKSVVHKYVNLLDIVDDNDWEEPPRTRTTGSERATGWIEPGQEVVVAGRKISGMIYLGSEPHQNSWRCGGSALIDPALPVAKVGTDYSGESLPYWPSYFDINPQARATYLDWLAAGRSDKRIGVGYVFLFFYGLEQRFFVDSPSMEEKENIIAETDRLLKIYGENHSVCRYLRAFLDAAQVVIDSADGFVPQFERTGYELPLPLRVAIGRIVKEGRLLSADWLLSWYMTHPETRLRTVISRAFPEFKIMFSLLFDERFPEGLKIRVPKRLLHARYSSASGAFAVDLNDYLDDIPDVSGLSKPLNVAKKLVEEVSDELDKYSRFLGRNPNGRGTIEAHALLPQRLWPLFPCAEMEELRHWAERIIEGGGLTPIEHLIERLEGATPEKMNKRQLTGAADALARLSIGMAPDPRFALRSPKRGEPVVLFQLPERVQVLEDVSEQYKAILVAITMGSLVAHADGQIAAKERSMLESRIDSAGLSKVEQARLHANLQWMLKIPPDLSWLRRHLKEVPEHTRHELGQVALAIAVADGAIDSGEIKAIEKLYSAIGLPTDGVYSDLHALSANSEPITVRPAIVQTSDYAIPPPPRPVSKVVLDADRVASLIADTARISTVLNDIFGEEDPTEEQEKTQEETNSEFPGLDAQHAAFLGELLTRSNWDETGFITLAGQFRLMHAGALETVNEWSFENFGDVLVEEYEGYELNPVVVAELNN